MLVKSAGKAHPGQFPQQVGLHVEGIVPAKPCMTMEDLTAEQLHDMPMCSAVTPVLEWQQRAVWAGALALQASVQTECLDMAWMVMHISIQSDQTMHALRQAFQPQTGAASLRCRS